MRIRIISLGEIVTPNIMKTIAAFTGLIAAKKSSDNTAEIGTAIGGVLQANMNLLNDFKLGKIDEADFTAGMISALESATEVKLTVDEFDNAWKAMCPVFSQFESLLKQAMEFNQRADRKVIFISFTNPKDVKHLIEQLQLNSCQYQVENDQLIEIAGIKLLTSYTVKKSKAELIESVVSEFRVTASPQSCMAASMGTIFGSVQSTANQQDIKYIRGVNNIKDPILQADYERESSEVRERAANLFIHTIFWERFENKSLTDILDGDQNVSRHIPSAIL